MPRKRRGAEQEVTLCARLRHRVDPPAVCSRIPAFDQAARLEVGVEVYADAPGVAIRCGCPKERVEVRSSNVNRPEIGT
jgi:hypothetical protein